MFPNVLIKHLYTLEIIPSVFQASTTLETPTNPLQLKLKMLMRRRMLFPKTKRSRKRKKKKRRMFDLYYQ